VVRPVHRAWMAIASAVRRSNRTSVTAYARSDLATVAILASSGATAFACPRQSPAATPATAPSVRPVGRALAWPQRVRGEEPAAGATTASTDGRTARAAPTGAARTTWFAA